MSPWGAVIGGIFGGIAGGVTQAVATRQRSKAYSQAADELKKATEKYSGRNAFNNLMTQGYNQAKGAAVGTNDQPIQTGGLGVTQYANSNLNNGMGSAFSTGASNAAQLNDAKYNAIKQQQEMNMKQADTNAGVINQTGQAVANTAGGLAQLYGQTKGTSDEKAKEDLEPATIEDSLRQLETVLYKYKEDTGLDQDPHVGTTAQSLEKQPLFEDVVTTKTLPNGEEAKAVDEWKLMESLTAAEAQLQKEIDELKESDTDE